MKSKKDPLASGGATVKRVVKSKLRFCKVSKKLEETRQKVMIQVKRVYLSHQDCGRAPVAHHESCKWRRRNFSVSQLENSEKL